MHAPKWLIIFSIACFVAVDDGHAQVVGKQPKFVLTVESELIESAKSDSGLKMIVSMPADPVAGAPIPIRFVLRNEGNSNLSAWLPRYMALGITTPDGESAPLTRFGKIHFEPDLSQFLRTSAATVNEIGPDHACTITIPNVALYYDLSIAGEYSVTVRVRVKKEGDSVEELTVGPLRVVVRNPVLMETTRK